MSEKMSKVTLLAVIAILALIVTVSYLNKDKLFKTAPKPAQFSTTDELIREALAKKEAVDKVEALEKMINCSSLVGQSKCKKLLRRLAQEKDIVSALTKIYNKGLFIWVSGMRPNRVGEDGWVVFYYKSSTEDIKKFLGLSQGNQK